MTLRRSGSRFWQTNQKIRVAANAWPPEMSPNKILRSGRRRSVSAKERAKKANQENGERNEKQIKNKNVVGNVRANDDASIEEMQKDAAEAAGLVEVPEAGNGTAGEESKSPAALPPSPAPAEGEDAPDPLAALLAAQVKPATVSAGVQQSAGEQAEPQDGAEVAAAGASDRTGAD